MSDWVGVARLPSGVGLFHSPRTSPETRTHVTTLSVSVVM